MSKLCQTFQSPYSLHKPPCCFTLPFSLLSGAIALSYPPLFIDDSGGEFHAYYESYRDLGLKINKKEVIHLQSSPKILKSHKETRLEHHHSLTMLKNKHTTK